MCIAKSQLSNHHTLLLLGRCYFSPLLPTLAAWMGLVLSPGAAGVATPGMDAPRERWDCSKLKLREAGGNAFSANSQGDRARCWERLKGEVQSQLFGGAFPQLNFHRCKERRKRVGVRMCEPKEPLFLNITFIQVTLGQEPALVGSPAAATPNSHLLRPCQASAKSLQAPPGPACRRAAAQGCRHPQPCDGNGVQKRTLRQSSLLQHRNSLFGLQDKLLPTPLAKISVILLK